MRALQTLQSLAEKLFFKGAQEGSGFFKRARLCVQARPRMIPPSFNSLSPTRSTLAERDESSTFRQTQTALRSTPSVRSRGGVANRQVRAASASAPDYSFESTHRAGDSRLRSTLPRLWEASMTTFCSTFFTFIIFCANLRDESFMKGAQKEAARTCARCGAPQCHRGFTGPVGFGADVRHEQCPGAASQAVPAAGASTRGASSHKSATTTLHTSRAWSRLSSGSPCCFRSLTGPGPSAPLLPSLSRPLGEEPALRLFTTAPRWVRTLLIPIACRTPQIGNQMHVSFPHSRPAFF